MTCARDGRPRGRDGRRADATVSARASATDPAASRRASILGAAPRTRSDANVRAWPARHSAASMRRGQLVIEPSGWSGLGSGAGVCPAAAARRIENEKGSDLIVLLSSARACAHARGHSGSGAPRATLTSSIESKSTSCAPTLTLF